MLYLVLNYKTQSIVTVLTLYMIFEIKHFFDDWIKVNAFN